MIPFSRVFIGKFDHFQFELFLLITLADNLHVGLDGQLDIGVITKNRHLLVYLSLRLVFPILFVFFLFLSFFRGHTVKLTIWPLLPPLLTLFQKKKRKVV